MKTLLDTHVTIWFISGDRSLSNKAIAEIESNAEQNFVSIASIWEIAIKVRLGKLELNNSFKEFLYQLEINSFKILPITTTDTFAITTLPFHHRDPFDRMIVAQAITNGMRLVTKDEIFKDYGVATLW
jgi:PIN domain nuclease of toxin-antitoxin system